MYSLLSQRRLRLLGHVRRMKDGRLPKDILYGQLTNGARPVGRPALRFKDAYKRDMKACDISPKRCEAVAEYRTAWRQATRRSIERADENTKSSTTTTVILSCLLWLRQGLPLKNRPSPPQWMLPKCDKLTTGYISIVSSRLRAAY